MQIRLVKMAGAYSKPFNICLFWYYIKQIINVFIRAMVRIFSFGERWNVPFNSAVASLNGTFHLSPHENILTIALINIHYLYNIVQILNEVILHTLTCNVLINFFQYFVKQSTLPIALWSSPNPFLIIVNFCINFQSLVNVFSP